VRNTTTVSKQVYLFEINLKAKGYAKSTISSYSNVVKQFLKHFKMTPKRINVDQITEWISTRVESATKSQIRGALSNYYEHVVGQPKKFERIPYPKKSKKLPVIMSQREVKQRLDNIQNSKHKSIISLLYGAGLRRDELICLHISDINKERKTIHVHQGKGAKDRIIPISENMLILLREYYRQYKPVEYLFEGQKGGKYSPQSVRNICKQHMNTNPHNLRHCYSTYEYQST